MGWDHQSWQLDLKDTLYNVSTHGYMENFHIPLRNQMLKAIWEWMNTQENWPYGHSRGDVSKPYMSESRAYLRQTSPLGTRISPREKMRWRQDEHRGNQMHQTALQNFCNKFNENKDPYEHVTQYHQLLYDEGVTNMHMRVQGFGLTLSNSAWSWFQTLKSNVLYKFNVLINYFIEA